jgi:hypothetical protein
MDPKWLIYEKAVARLKSSFGDCEVIHDHTVIGQRSGIERQVDVWLFATVGSHAVTVAVECRCYETEPVGIRDVDAFYGFLDDVGANKGVLVSNSGFTSGARARSDGSIVELQTLTLEEAMTFDWVEYVTDRCQSLAGCRGFIVWDESLCEEGGGQFPPSYQVGFCDSCGVLHIRCGRCGELSFYPEEPTIQCDGCEIRWELDLDRDGELISIRQVGSLDESVSK